MSAESYSIGETLLGVLFWPAILLIAILLVKAHEDYKKEHKYKRRTCPKCGGRMFLHQYSPVDDKYDMREKIDPTERLDWICESCSYEYHERMYPPPKD